MLKAFVTFIGVGVALNLMIAGATGRLYEFWSGRRGGARLFATISSLSVRLLLSAFGIVVFVISLYIGWRALSEFFK